MNQYAKNVNRLTECFTNRMAFNGRKPVLADLVGQLSIRASTFSKNIANVEISCVRNILRHAEFRGGKLWLGRDINHHDWIYFNDSHIEVPLDL
ncbi:hypothetical protein [Roseovarius arcticus]|uniref:hypothetical protein n=1 Tax=Roseovarius arcticus TaxID=2547404 RepID=UPI001110BBEE|nr:hypothetical protein [Roseovarius arcticus]